jgi:hypothetical protein
VVVAVRDLDASARTWERLGFTLSPRGTHSPQMGSGNYTIMFGDDYMELLGILAETEQNKATRDFLAKREGIERTAFTTTDAVAGAAELKARGLVPLGPVSFSRPVDLPKGGTGEAKFNVFRWPLDQNPGGMRIFACQQLTRNMVWIPELQSHANAVTGIARIEILSADPKAAAEHMSRLIDQPVKDDAGVYVVPSGSTRADFVFYDAAAFSKRYPEAVRQGAGSEGAVALVLKTADMAKAKAVAGVIAHDGALSVAAKNATGVVVSFVAK